MKKRKLVSGILALCLALSAAGCGKDSQEQQAANYYQQELGLDKEDAEDLAHDFYGKEDEEKPSVTEAPKETVVEPLPELVNSQWHEEKVQIYDMVFTNGWRMSADDATKIVAGSSEEDIRKAVAGSSYNVELEEGFDKNGELCLTGIKVDGKKVADLRLSKAEGRYSNPNLGSAVYGDECCYCILPYRYDDDGRSRRKTTWLKSWFEQEVLFSSSFKTRDDVLAYLSDNGFVEADKDDPINPSLSYYSSEVNEYADTSHYYSKGAQYIIIYRVLKIHETDQEIRDPRYGLSFHSGARLNLVGRIWIEFNPDGTVKVCTVDSPSLQAILGEETETTIWG